MFKLEPHLVKNLERFVSELGKESNVEIVITSTWKTALELNEIRFRFPPLLRLKVIGITPSLPAKEGARYDEIQAYLKTNGLEEKTWLAIDDDPLGFPPNLENLLLCDPEEGFQWTSMQGGDSRR